MGDLIRDSANANAWTLRLLLTQLYDPAQEVCEKAVHLLEEACDDKDTLQLVVEMAPTMDHLGELGQFLLLKYVFAEASGAELFIERDNLGFCRPQWVSVSFTMLATSTVRWICGSMYDPGLHLSLPTQGVI